MLSDYILCIPQEIDYHSKTWKSCFKNKISQIKLQIKSFFFWNEISCFKKKKILFQGKIIKIRNRPYFK